MHRARKHLMCFKNRSHSLQRCNKLNANKLDLTPHAIIPQRVPPAFGRNRLKQIHRYSHYCHNLNNFSKHFFLSNQSEPPVVGSFLFLVKAARFQLMTKKETPSCRRYCCNMYKQKSQLCFLGISKKKSLQVYTDISATNLNTRKFRVITH